jgi:hypothetical protein
MKILRIILTILVFTIFLIPAKSQYVIQYKGIFAEYGKVLVGSSTQSIICNQTAFGINVNSGGEYFNGIIEYDYRRINTSEFISPQSQVITAHELYLGLRYFPMRPTFIAGNAAVRLSAGFMGGFDMDPDWIMLAFAGVTVSPIRSTSGVSLNFVYRPQENPAAGYILNPAFSVRLGITFGPRAN